MCRSLSATLSAVHVRPPSVVAIAGVNAPRQNPLPSAATSSPTFLPGSTFSASVAETSTQVAPASVERSRRLARLHDLVGRHRDAARDKDLALARRGDASKLHRTAGVERSRPRCPAVACSPGGRAPGSRPAAAGRWEGPLRARRSHRRSRSRGVPGRRRRPRSRPRPAAWSAGTRRPVRPQRRRSTPIRRHLARWLWLARRRHRPASPSRCDRRRRSPGRRHRHRPPCRRSIRGPNPRTRRRSRQTTSGRRPPPRPARMRQPEPGVSWRAKARGSEGTRHSAEWARLRQARRGSVRQCRNRQPWIRGGGRAAPRHASSHGSSSCSWWPSGQASSRGQQRARVVRHDSSSHPPHAFRNLADPAAARVPFGS